jgi:hypothetical protein
MRALRANPLRSCVVFAAARRATSASVGERDADDGELDPTRPAKLKSVGGATRTILAWR